jgi:hypothetical protein
MVDVNLSCALFVFTLSTIYFQIPFYPPQQMFEDFSTKVVPVGYFSLFQFISISCLIHMYNLYQIVYKLFFSSEIYIYKYS